MYRCGAWKSCCWSPRCRCSNWSGEELDEVCGQKPFLFSLFISQVVVVGEKREASRQREMIGHVKSDPWNISSGRPAIGTTRLLLSPACRLQLRPAHLESRVINEQVPREAKTTKERTQWVFSFHHHSATQEWQRAEDRCPQ